LNSPISLDVIGRVHGAGTWLGAAQRNGRQTTMARILVIDDEAEMRTVIEQTLNSAGHEVISTADGRDGISRHSTIPADLIITDLFMPRQDGLETIMELRKNHPHVAVIAISGNPIKGTMLQVALQLGAVAVLEKPFHLRDLLIAVEKALGLKPGSAGVVPE
jgi:CheY-like chemotaxis protein